MSLYPSPPPKPKTLPAIGEVVFSKYGRKMRVTGHSCYAYDASSRGMSGHVVYQDWTVDMRAIDDASVSVSWWPEWCIRRGQTLPLPGMTT